MSADIETYGDLAAFAGARELPWHRLGTTTAGAMTAEEALTLAHLADWNIRKEPIYTNSGGTLRIVSDKFAMVRDNPFTHEEENFAGVVGQQYEPVQNEAHAEFLNTLTEESGAHIETAGSLNGGREVFVSMRMPETILIGGKDPLDTYITAVNSHDGQSAFRVITTPVRVVCKNTLTAALRQATRTAKVRHTAGNGGAIARVREALGITFRYMEEFESEVEAMIQADITSQRFGQIVGMLYPITDKASDLVNRRAQTNRDEVRSLFDNSPTMADIRGTAWAGYNAVTEYLDHTVETRGDESAEDVRARYNLAGRTDALKEQAFRLFASV